MAAFHFNLGNALDRLGRHADAVNACREALRLEPDSFDAHNNMGNALLNLDKVVEFGPHFERALALQPDSAIANFNIGNFFRTSYSLHKGIEY